jgi:acetylcholinesterase
MLHLAAAAALLGVAYAQNSTLPTVDLGYEIYRASTFNVRLSPWSESESC